MMTINLNDINDEDIINAIYKANRPGSTVHLDITLEVRKLGIEGNPSGTVMDATGIIKDIKMV